MSEFAVNQFVGVEPTVTLAGLGWVLVAAWLAVVFALTLKKAPWGFATVLAVTPLYQFRGNLGLPTTFLELTLGAVLLAWLIQYRRYPLRFDRTWPWLGVMLIGALIAALVSPDTREGLGLWRAFFLEPIAFFLAASAVFRKESTAPLFYGLLGSLGVITTWAAVQAVGPSDLSYDGRLLGAYQSANFLAMAVVPVIIAALFWPARQLPPALRTRQLVRAVPAVIGGILLLASQSRGGFIALGVGLGIALLYNLARFKRSQLIAMLAAGVVAVGVAVPLLYHRDPTILPIRRILAEQAVGYIADHPVFGVGPGQFQSRVAERYLDDTYYTRYFVPYAPNAHNLVLVIWVEWGLAVLVAMIGLLITIGERIKTIPREWQVVTLAILAGMLVHGLVDVPILKNDLAILFMTVLVLVVATPVARRTRGQ
jgi:O-antigen ligase